MATQTDVKSPLHETVATTPTDYWNDSCSIEELTYAIAQRRGRRDVEPDDRRRGAAEGDAPLARPDRAS